MVRFHTLLLVLTWATACGSGPVSPGGAPSEPPGVVVGAPDDGAIADLPPPPPRLACEPGTTPQPGDAAGWYCTRADGVRHGAFVQLFPSGAIERRGTYASGVLDGAWQRLHPNGTVAERGTYAGGLKDGTWQQTSERGTELGSYTLTAGTGTEQRWHASGARFSEVALRGGVPHGVTKYYGPDGGVLEVARYVNGKLHGARTVGTHRTVRIEETYANGVRQQTRKLWQFGMLLLAEAYDRAGRLHGDYTTWRSRRVTRMKGRYDHGKRSGTWTWRDRADKREREGAYVAGKRDGTWTEWWNGRVTFSGTYAAGKPIGTFTYYNRAGTELGSFAMRDGTGTMETFHPNRKPSSKQRFSKGVEDGVYQQLSPRGKVLTEGHYRGGQRHGTWKEWTHDGVLVLEQSWSRGQLDGTVKKYVDGQLSLAATYAAGQASGAYVEYRDGKPAVTGQFIDDRKTGTWTHLDAGGTVVLSATYAAGVLDGPYRQIVAHGAVLAGEMRAGRRSGTWTKTDKAGVVRQLDYAMP